MLCKKFADNSPPVVALSPINLKSGIKLLKISLVIVDFVQVLGCFSSSLDVVRRTYVLSCSGTSVSG
jgi:hypothetical protein